MPRSASSTRIESEGRGPLPGNAALLPVSRVIELIPYTSSGSGSVSDYRVIRPSGTGHSILNFPEHRLRPITGIGPDSQLAVHEALDAFRRLPETIPWASETKHASRSAESSRFFSSGHKCQSGSVKAKSVGQAPNLILLKR